MTSWQYRAYLTKMANQIRQEMLEMDSKILIDNKSKYNSQVYVQRCQVCNETATEVHHIKFQCSADDNDMIGSIHKNRKSNLVALCNSCHTNVHHGDLIINGYIQTSEGVKLDYSKKTKKILDLKKSRQKYNDSQIETILKLFSIVISCVCRK